MYPERGSSSGTVAMEGPEHGHLYSLHCHGPVWAGESCCSSEIRWVPLSPHSRGARRTSQPVPGSSTCNILFLR